ncbi:hypothetical protein [Bacillus subtilis]|uniref:hypothetical protein n=1 Tax=Bacillus subtilis TaxID=1423 RepID=UPI00202A32D3|nr:hypothetical protein [Bacillus subtilis]
MKLLDIGALQQSSQGLSGPKGSGVNSASGLFKQLLSGAGAQSESGLVNAETAGATLSINDAMQIIEKWMQSPEEGIDENLLSALQTPYKWMQTNCASFHKCRFKRLNTKSVKSRCTV